jgi:large subunit ribosomal protein L33
MRNASSFPSSPHLKVPQFHRAQHPAPFVDQTACTGRSPSGYNLPLRLIQSFCAARRFDGVDGMAKSKKKAETVFLVCEETGDHNYILRRKPGGEKLKLKKYSPRLRKHTMHTEKKK